MGQENPGSSWNINWLKPTLLWNKQAIRPAEIGNGLCRVMLSQENLLEDAEYNKIVPNHFVVELAPLNYSNHYEPLRERLIKQWHERLSEYLMTANSRLGRKLYQFGGQLRIEIAPASDVIESHARILSRIEPDLSRISSNVQPEQEVAFLEMIDENRRWPLYQGTNTIGRDISCNIFLDIPVIQEKRLVSGEHALIRVENEQYTLFDGGRSGRPSINGTYLNSQRVPGDGLPLQDGDIIILAAAHPDDPRLDTPGVAAFRFRKGQKQYRKSETSLDRGI